MFGSVEANRKDEERLKQNNYSLCFHWLPKSGAIAAGFVDFRRLETVAWDEVDARFRHLNARVAPSFVKDIVSRFSAFYARQGQPDISA